MPKRSELMKYGDQLDKRQRALNGHIDEINAHDGACGGAEAEVASTKM